MKVYTRVVIDMASGCIVHEDSYDYTGHLCEAKGTVNFPPDTSQEIGIKQAQLDAMRRAEQRDEDLEPYIYASYRLTRNEGGVLRRMTEDEYRASLDPVSLAAYENLQLAQEREAKALRGELPLTESGQQRKAEEFRNFKEMMARAGNVITGDDPASAAATSTPGIQALKAFNERWGLYEEAERRGEITQGAASVLQRMGVASDIGAQTRAGMLQFPMGPAALAQSYTGLLQPYQLQRTGQFQAAQQTQANKAAYTAGILELAGTAIGTAGGIYALKSARKYKKDIEPTTRKDAKDALKTLRGLKTYTYLYKEETDGTPKRMGLMADEAPKEIVTPDREGLDVGRMVGLLTVATKALAEGRK